MVLRAWRAGIGRRVREGHCQLPAVEFLPGNICAKRPAEFAAYGGHAALQRDRRRHEPQRAIEFRTQVNGPGANLKGVELALQLPFNIFADGILGNFGVLGNVTFVDSDVDYTLSTAATALNSSGNPVSGPATVFTRPLLDLAKKAANATLYYEDGRFSARVSAAYRDSYFDSTSGNLNIFEGYDSIVNVDASIRYKLTDWIEVSLEGTNLTDAYRTRFVDDFSHRNYENNHFGRVFMAGVRVSM